jgi:hypothetical protein
MEVDGEAAGAQGRGPKWPGLVVSATFLRNCLKVSTRSESASNLKENWIEGRGAALFSVNYNFDRRLAKVRPAACMAAHVRSQPPC